MTIELEGPKCLDPQRLAEFRELVSNFPPGAYGGISVGMLAELLADRDYSEAKREAANDVREVARSAADEVCGSSGREALDAAAQALDRIVLLVDGDASPIPAPHVVEDFEQMKRSDDARALLRANGWVESEPGEWSPATSETWAINVTQCSPEILRALAVLAEDAQP